MCGFKITLVRAEVMLVMKTPVVSQCVKSHYGAAAKCSAAFKWKLRQGRSVNATYCQHPFTWFSQQCVFHGYIVCYSSSLEWSTTPEIVGINFWSALRNPYHCLISWLCVFNGSTAPIMQWGHPCFLCSVCVFLFQPLERLCASLEPNLACFILCFHANPTRSANERLPVLGGGV